MRLARNIAAGVLTATVLFGAGTGKLRADANFPACNDVQYFNYGAWLYDCYYISEGIGHADLHNACDAFCSSLHESWFGTLDNESGYQDSTWYIFETARCWCA